MKLHFLCIQALRKHFNNYMEGLITVTLHITTNEDSFDGPDDPQMNNTGSILF